MAIPEPAYARLLHCEHGESLHTMTMMAKQKLPTAFLPYIAGVSERVRKVCQDFNIRMVFRSGPTLRNLLTKAKDPLPFHKQSNVVHEVPFTCGKVYISETNAG